MKSKPEAMETAMRPHAKFANLGAGLPHSARHAALLSSAGTPPALATFEELRKRLVYIVSLEFAIGNLDALQVQASDQQRRRPHRLDRD